MKKKTRSLKPTQIQKDLVRALYQISQLTLEVDCEGREKLNSAKKYLEWEYNKTLATNPINIPFKKADWNKGQWVLPFTPPYGGHLRAKDEISYNHEREDEAYQLFHKDNVKQSGKTMAQYKKAQQEKIAKKDKRNEAELNAKIKKGEVTEKKLSKKEIAEIQKKYFSKK